MADNPFHSLARHVAAGIQVSIESAEDRTLTEISARWDAARQGFVDNFTRLRTQCRLHAEACRIDRDEVEAVFVRALRLFTQSTVPDVCWGVVCDDHALSRKWADWWDGHQEAKRERAVVVEEHGSLTRNNKPLRPLTDTERKILSLCRRKAHKGERIAHHLGLSNEHTRRLLARLKAEGRLRNTESGYRTAKRAT